MPPPLPTSTERSCRSGLAKLAGGVAVIKVGAATEVEMKEKKLRIEDALNATRAAVEEGIVAGGGTAYLNVLKDVAALLKTVSGDEKTGVQLVLKALEAPVRQIAANAGFEGSVIVNKILSSGKKNYGFDAYTEKYVDMMEAGIVDSRQGDQICPAECGLHCRNRTDHRSSGCRQARIGKGRSQCCRYGRNGRNVLIPNLI